MSDLTEFLLARIAEDEADADVLAKEIGRWHREQAVNGVDGSQGSIVVTAMIGSVADPARTLVECKAKRRIVERHAPSDERARWCAWCRGSDHAEYPCPDLCDIATVYADHPDYRDEWRP